MPRFQPAIIQVIAATIVLVIGVLVYLLDRPSAAVYLVPDSWVLGESVPPLFGAAGNHLPTFAHTFAFALYTSALLEPWRWSAVAACGWWWLLGSLFEIAQSDTWAASIAAGVPEWFADWPLLDNVAGYFIGGHFDSLDLASIALAAISAFIVIRMSHRTAGNVLS